MEGEKLAMCVASLGAHPVGTFIGGPFSLLPSVCSPWAPSELELSGMIMILILFIFFQTLLGETFEHRKIITFWFRLS